MTKKIETVEITLPGDLISIDDGARLLGVSRQAVYAAVAKGRIAHYRIAGRMIRVRRSDVLALVEHVEANPRPPARTNAKGTAAPVVPKEHEPA